MIQLRANKSSVAAPTNVDEVTHIESYIAGLPDSYIAPNKASLYAVEFNKLKAVAARKVMDLKEQVGDLKVRSKALKRKAYISSQAKTVEEKRLDRDCDDTYIISVREEETLEAKIEYIQTLVEICGNYHIYFRQISSHQ